MARFYFGNPRRRPSWCSMCLSSTKLISEQWLELKRASRYDYANVMSLVWHPSENIVCFATTNGEVFIYPEFLASEHLPLLQKPLQSAPFIHDPLTQRSANARRAPGAAVVNDNQIEGPRRKRARTPDSSDEILPLDDLDDDNDDKNDFIIDDDGAGYIETDGFRKRPHDLADEDGRPGKRRAIHEGWCPRMHASFQPGSTDWKGHRRYLCTFLLLPFATVVKPFG